MSFSEKTIAFLAQNHIHNSKLWFEEHKGDYEEYVKKPFTELIQYLVPTIETADDQIACNARKLSRIYRDQRFVKGGSMYRDSLWISLRRKRERFQCVPEFYFYAGVNGFGWGCGYYAASTATMEAVRELILAGDKSFKAAQKALKGLDKFYLWGDKYKRDRFPDVEEELKEWLNRKTVCVSYDGEDPELLYSDKLFEQVRSDLEKLTPLYKFYIKAEELRISKGK